MKSSHKYKLSIIIIAIFFFGCSSESPDNEKETVQYSLSIEASPTEGGTVSPVNGTYEEGSKVNIQANPSEGYSFKEWTGSFQSSENLSTITMDSNKSITGFFEEIIEECDQGIFVGDVVLTTQAEIEDFAGMCYTGISGDLNIWGFDNPDSVTDLSSLSGLKVVEGTIHIARHNNLIDLNGLENISLASGIIISELWKVESISSIENLITGVVASNRSDFTFNLNNCASIASIEVLQGLRDVKSIGIASNSSLTSLEGLGTLETVSADMVIVGLPLVESLADLNKLRTVGDELNILYNSSIISLVGLENLETVGILLKITNNDQLADLTALSTLSGIETIWIESNPSLTSLTGINITDTVFFKLSNNDALLEITGLEVGSTPTAFLELSYCDGLSSLKGLESLTETQGLLITNNENLTSLNGLENLTLSRDYVRFDSNYNLLDFCALTSLIESDGLVGAWYADQNAYNPGYQDMVNGLCKQ